MKIKKKNLNEETINDRVNSVASKLDDSDVVDYEDYDELVDTLDAALKSAKRELRAYEKTGRKPATFNNVLVTGLAGTGKTGRITAWAQSRGVNLVTRIANTISPEALNGIYRPDDEKGKAINLPTSEFDTLDAPNSVLFLDEFNRARPDQTSVFLKLMNEHLIPDGTQTGGLRFLPNLLFCVAAINPDDGDYQVGKLDPAALTRTYGIYLPTDPKKTLEYLSKRFDDQIKFAEEDGDEDTGVRCSSPLVYGEDNPIYGLEIYVPQRSNADMGVICQLIGNFGGYANPEYYDETNVIMLGEDTLKKLEQGIKDEIIIQIEKQYNQSSAKMFNIQFTSEPDFVAWVKKRLVRYPDESTLKLLEIYEKAH